MACATRSIRERGDDKSDDLPPSPSPAVAGEGLFVSALQVALPSPAATGEGQGVRVSPLESIGFGIVHAVLFDGIDILEQEVHNDRRSPYRAALGGVWRGVTEVSYPGGTG